MIVTSAPKSRAEVARAMPILPVERLLTKRTGSSGSCVPPTVITTCTPARGPLRPSTLRAISMIWGGSAMRPMPIAPEASRPSIGPTTNAPRCTKARDVLLRDRVQPHAGLHGRSQQQRPAAGQRGGAQGIIGQAQRQLGDGVGRGRRDQKEISLARQGHVHDLTVAQRPQVGGHRPAGERGES